MTRLLAAGTPVNAKQPGSGATPLNTAVLFGQLDTAKLLLEKGAGTAKSDRSTTGNAGTMSVFLCTQPNTYLKRIIPKRQRPKASFDMCLSVLRLQCSSLAPR